MREAKEGPRAKERERIKERKRGRKCRTQKHKNRAHVACRMRPARGVALYAHEISRRSNPPSRAPRERPVATLLSTSLRPMPPLLVHSDSGLARIVAYGVAALADATPSGTAGIPFHSVQPFNGALDRPSVRPSVRPLAALSTIYIPRHPSHPSRQLRTRRLEINDTNFSRMLPFSPLRAFPFRLLLR